MISKIYTVYDSKAEAYLPPVFVQTKGLMVRSFEQCANDPNHDFSKYPQDYTLFEIGEFDDTDGTITMYDVKESVGLAIEFKKEVK